VRRRKSEEEVVERDEGLEEEGSEEEGRVEREEG